MSGEKTCNQCGVIVSLELKNIWPSNWKGSRYDCIDCAKAKESIRRQTKEWKDYHSSYGKKHYVDNKDMYAENTKAYRDSPEGKAVRNNLGRQRKMKQKKATTNWIGDNMIAKVYRKAQEFGLAVDHIIPLDHKLVCGLHTWNNLQLLSASENSKKYNNFVADW